MKAGQTNYEVGAKARIKGVKGKDQCLNGHTGTLTHPFAFGETKKGWLGFRCDKFTAYGYEFNIHKSEIELI